MEKETIERVARAAHIALTDEEKESFGRAIGEILDRFKILDEAPELEGVGVNPVEIADVLRDDVPHMDMDPAELLKGMNLYENYVRGPRLS